jgi:SAM-dependent methyltransferase
MIGCMGLASFEDEYGAVTARFYDAAYAVASQVGADVGFYLELARAAGGPVLELGCGTGRVLLEIATQGIPCTGLDLSRQMLDALRAKTDLPTLRLVCAAMQDFDLGDERFALVYSAFRSFMHLYTVGDQLACLACVRRHLAPGGTFSFDVFNPRLDRIRLVEEPEAEDLRFEQDGEEIVRFTRVKRDHAVQIQDVTMRYERRRAGRPVGEELTRFRMRWFHRFELEHLLRRAGFAEVEIFGDFDRSPAGRETPAFVIVAR